MKKDNGYYHCKICKLYIEVVTSFRYRYNNQDVYLKVKIPFCPHCKGKLDVIGGNVYKRVKTKLRLNVNKTYSFKRKGKQSINMNLRFKK